MAEPNNEFTTEEVEKNTREAVGDLVRVIAQKHGLSKQEAAALIAESLKQFLPPELQGQAGESNEGNR